MARPTVTNVEAYVAGIYAAFASGNTPLRYAKARAAIHTLNELAAKIVEVYDPNITIDIVDEEDADLGEFFAGGLRKAKGRPVEVGDVFVVSGSDDTADNALATAKGSAVAAGDLFEVTDVASGTEAVAYLGSDLPDFSDEVTSEFTGQPGNLHAQS